MRAAPSDLPGGASEVRRSRLLDRLGRLPAGGIAVLRAPAGSGKTTLLAQLARDARSQHRAPIVLDCRHLDGATPATRQRGDLAVGAVPGSGAASGIDRLAPALADLDPSADIVLDHVDPAHQALADRLIAMVTEGPNPRSRVYLACRHHLSPGSLDLRLRNLVLDLDAGTLAFDDQELALLADAHGVAPARIEPWTAMLGGWVEPCAVLCRQLGCGPTTTDALVAACADLLGERVLGPLGERVLAFLMEVAVPVTLTVPLARELSEVEGSGAVLRALADAGVPLEPAGAEDRDWVLHPLLRQFLLRAAERRAIDTGRLHEIAWRHLGTKGRWADALHHAVESGRIADAVGLVEAGGGWRMVMQGVSPALVRALDQVSVAHVAEAPGAVLAKAFHLAKCGRTAEARALMTCLGQHRPPPSGRRRTLDPLAADIQLVDTHIGIYEDRAMDGADETRLHAVVPALAAGDTLGRALALNHLCTITLHLGEFALSQRYGESAMRLYEDAQAHFGAVHLHAHLGQIRLARGDLDGAAREYEVMAARACALPDSPGELVAIARALSAEVAYEINDVARSEALLEESLRSVEGSDAWLDVLAAAYRVAARLAYLRSSLPGALSALAHAERTAIQRSMPRLLRLIRIERIRALTLSDELGQAGEEIEKAGLARHLDGAGGLEADWATRQGSTAVTLARFLTRSRRASQALGVLEPAEREALRGGQMLAVAKLRILRATAHWQLRQRAEAIEVLCEAIRLLGKQPFRRFVLDEGAPVHDILQAALDKGLLLGGLHPQVRKKLAELNHLFTVADLPPRREAAPTRPSQRRPREDDVRSRQYVQLLGVGLSNKEIARTLGVSPNTVKYHLKRIFKELHVDSRSRAVFRARELGIVDS